jgi:hypothetical protein
VDGENPGWEYSVTNSFTHEVCRLGEDQIHHGANRGYLDYRRRDGIAWVQGPPDAARVDMANTFWKRTGASALRGRPFFRRAPRRYDPPTSALKSPDGS